MKHQQTAPRQSSGRTAFTIVEILVVVLIIGVLATLIMPKVMGRVGTAKTNVAKQKLMVIEEAVKLFRMDYGRFPTTLDELLTRPNDVPEEKWVSPTIKAKDMLDPWDRPFIYKAPGDHDEFDIYSLGADGQEGGTGENADVVSW